MIDAAQSELLDIVFEKRSERCYQDCHPWIPKTRGYHKRQTLTSARGKHDNQWRVEIEHRRDDSFLLLQSKFGFLLLQNLLAVTVGKLAHAFQKNNYSAFLL